MPWQNTVLTTTEKDSITTNSHSMHYVKLTRMPVRDAMSVEMNNAQKSKYR